MAGETILVKADKLAGFTRRLVEAAGVEPGKAKLVADCLVHANLRGVDSHGVQLLPVYVERIESGEVDAQADGHVVAENGCTMVYDGENAIGQVVSEVCCLHAIRLARRQGMSMVVARESNHFGAAAFWGERFSRIGMIGVVMCNASPIVPPWQGKEPRLATNPICVAVPGPWLLDMATTTVAANKLYKLAAAGEKTIPAGWAMDKDGVPTTCTQEALRGMMAPLGGYKGSGLEVMVEILCAVLGGGAMSVEVGGIRIHDRPSRTSQTFIGIDVARFMPVEEFTARVEKLVGLLKSSSPARGYDEVLVAGDPEWRTEAQRRREGIPIEAATWRDLLDTAARLGVDAPPAPKSAMA
jgi:LDH2 family malate/lactate/ureidoglycolate dehydrogenase